jgi:hypothetical protein
MRRHNVPDPPPDTTGADAAAVGALVEVQAGPTNGCPDGCANHRSNATADHHRNADDGRSLTAARDACLWHRRERCGGGGR